MIDPQSHSKMKQAIIERTKADKVLLDQLRNEIRPLKDQVRRIQPRSTTAVSLVATDGGNNRIQFDPFLIQLIRVVDSSNNELCLEAVSPTTDVLQLSEKQFYGDGSPRTALGELMSFLNIKQLPELSYMIRRNDDDRPTSPTWVQVYRELVEWAVLFSIVRNKDFGTDTIIIFDGLLRSKVFAKDLFIQCLRGIKEGIDRQKIKGRRNIYLAGVAKHSQVLSRYQLAMALENVLTTTYPVFLKIPREIEEKAYIWSEYARGDDREVLGAEVNKFVGGKMIFAKFGSGARDPIWPIDIFSPQESATPEIVGYMLADALNGFPIPYYPMCLQKAHENAALVDFDFDILQEQVFEGIREILEGEAQVLDVFRLRDADPAGKRYD